MQRGHDEAGNIWELDANGKPVRLLEPAASAGAPGGLAPRGTFIPTPAKPTAPYEAPQAAANLQRTQQEIAQADATAAAQAETAKAQARSAQIKAQQDEEAYASQHPKGSNATVLGPDSLSSLSGPDQELVKALATGRLAFPSGTALRSPWWQQKLEQVAAFDPSFDATNYNQRAKARAILLNGKVGTSANALNTAIGHTGHLNEQIGDTASHNWTSLNALINGLSQEFGSDGPTNFKDTAGKLASELTSTYRNGGGAEQDVIRNLQSLDPNMSLKQKQGIIRNTIELLASKQAANLYQYGLGMGGKADVDLLDPDAHRVLDQFPDIRDHYFAQMPQLGSQAAAVLKANGGTLPPPPSAPPPSDTPPTLGGGGGNVNESLATGGSRNVYDPVTSAKLNAMIHSGRPFEEAAAIIPAEEGSIDPRQYAAAVTYAKDHPNWVAARATKNVPTTIGQQIASSAPAAAVAGALSAGTAGLDDTAGRMLAGTSYDANRHALADTHPTADMVGNLAGGAAGAMAGEAALAKFAPGALGAASRLLGRFARPAGDFGYGALYGANENPDAPVTGALLGGLTATGAGMVGRGATRGLANVIAPPAGAFGPVYAQGIFPTLGQRFAKSGFPGRAINTAEQAMQSIPGLGAMVARARDIPRDAAQLGAFNQSLGELKPFDDVLGETVSALPAGMQPGTDPHVFAQKAFSKAYDTARAGMQFAPDAQYLADTQDLAKTIGSGVLSPQQAGQVKSVVDNAVVGRLKAAGGVLDGQAYQQAGSDLNRAISQWSRDPAMQPAANALSDYQTIFDNAARRNSDPAAVNLLDAADRGYAKYAVVRNAGARVGGDPGTFTMKNLQRAVQQEGGGVASGPFQRGQALMQDYSTAVQPLGDSLANSGTGDRLLTSKLFMGEQGAAGALAGPTLFGAAAAHPGALALAAPYVPGINALVTRAIAPRSATLSPVMAQYLEAQAARARQLAPFVGRAAVPGALAYFGGNS